MTEPQLDLDSQPKRRRPLGRRLLQLSVRGLMLIVLLVATFISGFQLGQSHPALTGPAPLAMEYTLKQKGITDEEASTIYSLAKWLENSYPGTLAHNPTFRIEPYEDKECLHEWKVTFHDPVTGKDHGYLTGPSPGESEFLQKKKTGFRLVAQ